MLGNLRNQAWLTNYNRVSLRAGSTSLLTGVYYLIIDAVSFSSSYEN